jgi:hypothetical protein
MAITSQNIINQSVFITVTVSSVRLELAYCIPVTGVPFIKGVKELWLLWLVEIYTCK